MWYKHAIYAKSWQLQCEISNALITDEDANDAWHLFEIFSFIYYH